MKPRYSAARENVSGGEGRGSFDAVEEEDLVCGGDEEDAWVVSRVKRGGAWREYKLLL
jgi:hypothetical protein